ncbi:YHYH domain-containing protein [Dehalobacterium formicoaceticum]
MPDIMDKHEGCSNKCQGKFLWLLSSIGLAHPGRLDSNGGHYVRKSGDF